MGHSKDHCVSIAYTKRAEAVSTVSTSVEKTPMELASRGLMRFLDDLHPWLSDKIVPEAVTVDGETFTVAEIHAWDRVHYEQSTKEAR